MLKVITPGQNTGYDNVGVTDFRAGMLAARTSAGLIIPCNATQNKVIGVLGDDHITSILQQTAQVQESIDVGSISADTSFALAHNAIVASSVVIADATAPGTAIVTTSNWTINTTTGVLTVTNGGALDGVATILVTYTFQLNDVYEKNFRGVNAKGSTDDVEGSQKVTVWKGYGEYETDQFDTSVIYAIDDKLAGANDTFPGLITKDGSTNDGAGPVIGRVTKLPTAASPTLGFEFIPALA